MTPVLLQRTCCHTSKLCLCCQDGQLHHYVIASSSVASMLLQQAVHNGFQTTSGHWNLDTLVLHDQSGREPVPNLCIITFQWFRGALIYCELNETRYNVHWWWELGTMVYPFTDTSFHCVYFDLLWNTCITARTFKSAYTVLISEKSCILKFLYCTVNIVWNNFKIMFILSRI